MTTVGHNTAVQNTVESGAERTAWESASVRKIAVFALVGAGTTLLHLGLFALLRVLWSAQAANVAALAIATVVNTAANRHWTFGVRDRRQAGRHQVQGFVVFGITLALTSAGLGLLHWGWPQPPRLVELAAIAVATFTTTALKYVLMRRWVFAR